MRIKVNPFDTKSISNAIKQIEQYKKDFLAKEELFVKRLAEIGVSVASTGFALADYDGVNGNVEIRWEHTGNKATVIAEGYAVGFIEFGTGVRYPEWVDNNNVSKQPYKPDAHGTYGKGKGANPDGWWFTARGEKDAPDAHGASMHTYGNPPAEAMKTARDVMIEKVTQIAREVWR